MSNLSEGVYCYAVGLCNASVCAPSDMSVKDVEAAVNQQHPTGVGPWTLSTDAAFATGEPHPKPCENDASRTHYLFHC